MYITYTAAKRFWIYFIDKNGTYGSDLHNLNYWKKTRNKAYVFVDFAINSTTNLTASYQAITHTLESLLKSPTSSLRLRINTDNEKIEHNTQLRLQDIIEWCENDHDFYHFNDEQQRDLVFRFYLKKSCFAVLFDHTVFDGINLARQVAQPILQYRPFSNKQLQQDHYRPIASEIHQLITMIRLANSTLWAKALPRHSQLQQTVVHHEFATSEIKLIKKAHQTTFSNGLLAYTLVQLFDSMDTAYHSLRIGIIMGFDNPRFRNNYSICRITIKRASSIACYVEQIKQQIKKNQHEIQPLYQIFSTHDFQTNFKYKVIDALFSPLLFFPHKGLSRHMGPTHFFTVPCAIPIYIFANTFGQTIYSSSSLNTPAIDPLVYAHDNGKLFTFNDEYTHIKTTTQHHRQQEVELPVT